MQWLIMPVLLLILLWSLVVVRSTTFPYVSFLGKTLANHSYVDLSLVGRPKDGSDSVQCHTDLRTCCSQAQGSHRGDWYFPDGNRLQFNINPGDIYEHRVAQRVDLRHRNRGYSSSGGIYQCDISVHDEGDNFVRDRVYVGVYPSGEGIVVARIHCK